MWLWKIPCMLRWVQLLVLLYCSWMLVVVVDLCCQFFENDELHHYLFLNWLKAGMKSFYNKVSLIYLTVFYLNLPCSLWFIWCGILHFWCILPSDFGKVEFYLWPYLWNLQYLLLWRIFDDFHDTSSKW